jgi:hypothetical protein
MMAVNNGIQNTQPIGYMRTLGAAINSANSVPAQTQTQSQAASQTKDQIANAPKEESEGQKLDEEEAKDSEKDDKKPEKDGRDSKSNMEVAKTNDNYDDDDDDSKGRNLQNRSLAFGMSVLGILGCMVVNSRI